jgi:hypothetical protein
MPMGDTGYHPPQKQHLRQSHTRRPRSRVSTWIARYACGADDEQHPAAYFSYLAGVDHNRNCHTLFPRHASPSPSFAQVILHLSYPSSRLLPSLSVSSFHCPQIYYDILGAQANAVPQDYDDRRRDGKRFNGIVTYNMLAYCSRKGLSSHKIFLYSLMGNH